jgi:long-chain acyl-CoA synthetase
MQPWFNSYPDFVDQNINLDRYENIVNIFDESVAKYGNKVAYKNMDVTLTFNEVNAHVDALVWYFQNKTTLKKGDRIALQMPNLLRY